MHEMIGQAKVALVMEERRFFTSSYLLIVCGVRCVYSRQRELAAVSVSRNVSAINKAYAAKNPAALIEALSVLEEERVAKAICLLADANNIDTPLVAKYRRYLDERPAPALSL